MAVWSIATMGHSRLFSDTASIGAGEKVLFPW